MSGIQRMLHTVLFCFLGAAAVGCACKGEMKMFDVNVRLDDSVRRGDGRVEPVEVHLIAANPSTAAVLESVSMTDYWEPDNKLRESMDKHIIKLDDRQRSGTLPRPGNRKTAALAKQWNEWKEKGATRLFILSSYPSEAGKEDDRPGDADPRRKSVPLECEWWNGIEHKNKIDVAVKSGGLELQTSPRSSVK